MEERKRGEQGTEGEARSSIPPPESSEEAEKSQADVFRERWVRVSADLDNLRKRTERHIEAARLDGELLRVARVVVNGGAD